MFRFFQRFVFLLSIALCLALVSGVVLGEYGLLGVRADGQDGAYKQNNVYREVLERIQSDYVTEPNINNVTTGALHGLLVVPSARALEKRRPGAAGQRIHGRLMLESLRLIQERTKSRQD